MTPLEYLDRYYNLEVPVDDAQGTTQWVKVKVACYRLGEDGLKSRENFLSKLRPHLDEKGETIKVKVKSVYGEEEKTFRSRGEIAPFVAAPFFGKGSPEDVQIVLQLAVRYGYIGSTQQEIQDYCSWTDSKRQMGHIGLDCNGFVGNFLRHTVGGSLWDQKPGKDESSLASTGIRDLMSKVGTPVKTFEELIFNKIYVLGRVDKSGTIINRYGKDQNDIGHIMISQPLTLRQAPVYHPMRGYKIGEVPALQVIESTGQKGLVESIDQIWDLDKRGIFTVWRGSKQEEMKVRIFRVFGF
jgi:hypothetical protein